MDKIHKIIRDPDTMSAIQDCGDKIDELVEAVNLLIEDFNLRMPKPSESRQGEV